MHPGGDRILHGLPPVVREDAAVLILGSFPSRRSLETGQYYANPQNQFWKIIGSLTGFDHTLPYEERLQCVVRHRLALWDAIGSCRREGSADSRIVGPVYNDIAGLLSLHPGIRHVACNGSASARSVQQLRLPAQIRVIRLPSTSPAHARLSLDGKIRAWSVIREYR